MTEAPEAGRFVVDLPTPEAALALAGSSEQTLRQIEALTGVSLVMRGLQLEIRGRPSQLERTAAVVELLRSLWQEGETISPVDLQAAFQALDTGRNHDHAAMGQQVLARSQKGNLLRPRTLRQKAYVEAMERHDLTFALGPAGTCLLYTSDAADE